jgi:hypothetical protein
MKNPKALGFQVKKYSVSIHDAVSLFMKLVPIDLRFPEIFPVPWIHSVGIL